MILKEVVEPVVYAESDKICHIRQVFIIDNCPMIQIGIRHAFAQSGIQVSGYHTIPKIDDVLVLMHRYRADLVMMELGGSGDSVLASLRVISQFLSSWPCARLIVCTRLTDSRLLKQLIMMGVRGIYLKHEPLSVLAQCVFQVMEGNSHYSSQIGTVTKGHRAPPYRLTQRELDVLEHLFMGKSVTTTAQALDRDIRTVSTHKRNAMFKLGFNSGYDLYSWAARMSYAGIAACGDEE